MVVKDKEGRNRYIFFRHSDKISRRIINSFLNEHFSNIKIKLIKFGTNNGIIKVEHLQSNNVRNIMNSKGKNLELRTIKTSGTLRTLKGN